jgi:hypothetical protein
MSREQPSKSMRVQDYMRAHPQSRNRDVVEALSEYGVTAADVSNAKAQLKKKGSRQRSRSSVTAAVAAAPGETATSDPNNTISLVELEAAIEYVQTVGGLARAMQLLAVVQQIQAL